MGDLDKSIHRKDETPYEKIIVNPVEGDKKGREGYTSLKNATRPQVFAALASYFKKILSALSFQRKGRAVLIDEQRLLDDVRALRDQLQKLSIEDLSHNPDFTQTLSELWHNLLDDCNSLSLPNGASLETLAKVNFFITQVHNYPLGADHTLGYYFDHYAGKDWVPFPFMSLLQSLHENYKKNPKLCELTDWIKLLGEILGEV